MLFKILNSWGDYNGDAVNQFCLVWDNWNDYSFYTLFGAFYVDENSQKHDLGALRIGFVGQEKYQRVFAVDYSFDYIGDDYFSLGTSEEYYEKLNGLPSAVRELILENLNDIAKNPQIFAIAVNEPVVQISFFRDLHPDTVLGQFKRLADGGVSLTPYSFEFRTKLADYQEYVNLLFDILPDSLPPTNIHVLIGRNGVGKTTLIDNMIDSLTVLGNLFGRGSFKFNRISSLDHEVNSFANLISVSFSVFDEIDLRLDEEFINGMKYSYIGMRKPARGDVSEFELKNLDTLAEEFYESLMVCNSRSLLERLTQALKTLSSDPNFEKANLIDLINELQITSKQDVLDRFKTLSSGHKIILLTITKLVEKLQEKSLILMDEPEAHLHPPLLSAFIRAVSDLLITTNGAAIVATHSPVILQEVPKSCVWKLRRPGSNLVAERLTRESFGENVGTLTNDVFGLEVKDSGFYKLLGEAVKSKDYNYQSILDSFNHQLGSEAKSIIMALIANYKKRHHEED